MCIRDRILAEGVGRLEAAFGEGVDLVSVFLPQLQLPALFQKAHGLGKFKIVHQLIPLGGIRQLGEGHGFPGLGQHIADQNIHFIAFGQSAGADAAGKCRLFHTVPPPAVSTALFNQSPY